MYILNKNTQNCPFCRLGCKKFKKITFQREEKYIYIPLNMSGHMDKPSFKVDANQSKKS